MTTPVITYQILLSTALSKIINSCTNVSGTIPNEYKSGYSKKDTIKGSGDRQATVTLTTKISSGIVTAVNSSTVTTQYNTYMNDIISKASQNVTTRGLAQFYNKLASFCTARITSCSSQMTTTNIMVYNSGDVSYTNVTAVSENELITATQDVTLAIQLASSIINNKTRCSAARYSRTISCAKQ